MATPGFLSKRVKKKSQTGLTTDRYEFLGLDQAEPDLGDPLVGLSSVGANPAPIGGTQYVLVAASGNTGKRYWIPTSNLSSTGLIPGSFTVFNNNIQVGAANSFNRFNFVGTGVTVDFVGAAVTQQTGIATVRITVTDLVGPGNVNSIPYKASSGLLAGATDFVYSSGSIGIGSTQPTVKLDVIGSANISNSVGVGTTNPTSKLHVVGDVRITGVSTLGITTTTNLTSQQLNVSGITTVGFITATNLQVSGITTVGFITATNLQVSGITTVGFITATNLRVSGITTVGFITATNLQVSGVTTLGIVTSGNIYSTGIITATGGFNIGIQSGGTNITTGVITAINFVGSGNTFSYNSTTKVIDVTISGSSVSGGSSVSISTNTTNQAQYIPYISSFGNTTGFGATTLLVYNPSSGNLGIGTTTPTSKLHIEGGGRFTGIVTATSFSGSGIGLTDLLSNTVSTSSTTVPQYIGFLTTTSGTITSNLVSSTLTYIPSSGNLGIGTTNPRTPLQVETYGIKTGVGTFTASVGVSTTIDSFSISSTDFKIAEYTVHIGVGPFIQAQKVLVMQDQTNVYSQEYGVMYNNSLIVSIGATISGGNCILQATPQTGVSGLTNYRFVRNTLL